MLMGLAGLGIAHQTPLDSRFGPRGTNPLAGMAGLNTGLQSANGGNDLMQLAALLGGSQQQSVPFQPAQLLQVRHTLAQQATIQKRIEAEATKPAGELVKLETEKQKQKFSDQDANATKQGEDDTT